MTEAEPAQPMAEPLPPAVAEGIGRCAEALLDVDRLRGEVNALRALPGRTADFASALFNLEAARKGDADARADMLETADRLLVFWKDKSGDALARSHPTLGLLWADASALLVSFEVKRFKRALQACWEARGDAATLQSCIDDLQPEGNRRVEFARCLYHLELARLFVDASRQQFARRVGLVQEAYLSKDAALELVGDDEGLAHLWKELVPYLDEFFEAQEQEEERARKAAAKTDPHREGVVRTAPGAPEVAAAPEAQVVPSVAAAPAPAAPPRARVDPPPFRTLMPNALAAPAPSNKPPSAELEMVEVVVDAAAPPPPPDTTPRPGSLQAPALDESDDIEIVSVSPVSAVPPPQRSGALDVLSDYEPNAEALAFWRHTEAALGLLPNSHEPRSGQRVLAASDRGERKKLNAWLDGMSGRFTEVPDARAMQCLLKLYLATHIKEKTLFGAPNHKRKEAFEEALQLLSGDAEAVGRCAVWFELDGPQTVESLSVGLEMVADFLQYCARQSLDPLDAASPVKFIEST